MMVSGYDLGQAVFNAIRTGVPELGLKSPRSMREHDITDEMMLFQRRYRAACGRRLAQHNNGFPIRVVRRMRKAA